MQNTKLSKLTKRHPFIKVFEALSIDVHNIACDKGWWDHQRSDGDLIALMHSELSEALEALRNGGCQDDKIPDYKGVEAELADVIIRIMDAATARGWLVAQALLAKIEYNKTREYKHGKQF